MRDPILRVAAKVPGFSGRWLSVRTMASGISESEGGSQNRSFKKRSRLTKSHETFKKWLGPRNFKGRFARNKFYYPSDDHFPMYLTTMSSKAAIQTGARPAPSHPFPNGQDSRFNHVVTPQVKNYVLQQANAKASLYDISSRTGLKTERIQALVRLAQIEQDWHSSNRVTSDLKRYSRAMFKMMPISFDLAPPRGQQQQGRLGDNDQARDQDEDSPRRSFRSAIPFHEAIETPRQTDHPLYVTLPENQRFTSEDAARQYGIATADTILDLRQGVIPYDEVPNKNRVLHAAQKEGDRFEWKFTTARAGSVGFRYGARRDDRKKNRAVWYDENGRQIFR